MFDDGRDSRASQSGQVGPNAPAARGLNVSKLVNMDSDPLLCADVGHQRPRSG